MRIRFFLEGVKHSVEEKEEVEEESLVVDCLGGLFFPTFLEVSKTKTKKKTKMKSLRKKVSHSVCVCVCQKEREWAVPFSLRERETLSPYSSIRAKRAGQS